MKIVGCFLEYNGKFLILLRQSHKPNGNTWGLPAGKVEENENERDAVVREVYEETGYKLKDRDLHILEVLRLIMKINMTLAYIK